MITAYLGLGSNKGERINFINNALEEIQKIDGVSVIRSSSVYETEPWGNKDQDDYLNSAVEVETVLGAQTLLRELKGLEIKMGRQDNKRWSEREIDIDLLLYGNEIIVNENMIVPHPQIENRKFVLVPLNEIAPDIIHPVNKKKISELLKETKDDLKVSKYGRVKQKTFICNERSE